MEMTHYREQKRRFLVVRALAEMPQEADLPRAPREGVEEVRFESFEQFRRARRQMQANKVAVPREDFNQHLYDSISLLNRTAETSLNLNVLNDHVERSLRKHPVRLLPNDFPKELPADTSHWLLWHRPEISDFEKAEFLALQFLKYGIGGGEFFIYRNPEFLKSMLAYPHDHIFIKHNGGWFRPSPLQTTFLHPFFDMDLEDLQFDMDADWFWNEFIYM